MWLDVLGALVDRKSWKMANFQYIFDCSISVRVSFVWPVKYVIVYLFYLSIAEEIFYTSVFWPQKYIYLRKKEKVKAKISNIYERKANTSNKRMFSRRFIAKIVIKNKVD